MNPLDILNNSLTSEITKEQFVKIANSTITTPALVILYISMLIIFSLVGLAFVREDRSKLAWIIFVSAFIGAIVLLSLIFLPNLTASLAESIGGWF